MIEVLSPGKINGEIIIINSKKDLKEKNISNKIIVIKEITLEDLTELYAVKGIIVENGSLLSHLFIFIREIRIPCIKQKDALKIYKNKQNIEI